METRVRSGVLTPIRTALAAALAVACGAPAALASEADMVLPDLKSVKFLADKVDGWSLLVWGLAICVFGIVFGVVQYRRIKQMKVHKAMLDISELIYTTCKRYVCRRIRSTSLIRLLITLEDHGCIQPAFSASGNLQINYSVWRGQLPLVIAVAISTPTNRTLIPAGIQMIVPDKFHRLLCQIGDKLSD